MGRTLASNTRGLPRICASDGCGDSGRGRSRAVSWPARSKKKRCDGDTVGSGDDGASPIGVCSSRPLDVLSGATFTRSRSSRSPVARLGCRREVAASLGSAAAASSSSSAWTWTSAAMSVRDSPSVRGVACLEVGVRGVARAGDGGTTRSDDSRVDFADSPGEAALLGAARGVRGLWSCRYRLRWVGIVGRLQSSDGVKYDTR